MGAITALSIRRRFFARSARLVLTSLLNAILLSLPVYGARPDLGPPQARSQTINGITVRLKDIRWVQLGEAAPERVVADTHRKGLGVWYDIRMTSGKTTLPHGKTLSDYLSFRPLTPWSEEVAGISYQYPGFCWIGGMDPRWVGAGLEFEFRDPSAPPGVEGLFSDILQFKNLPLPQTPGSSIAVNRILTTPHGLRVCVDRVSRGADGAGPRVLFDVRWVPPPRVPDMTAMLSIAHLSDNAGRDLSDGTGFQSGYDLVRLTEIQRLVTRTEPSEGAGSLNLTVQVAEEAPSLKRSRFFRRFYFDIDGPAAPYYRTSDRPHKPVAVGITRDLKVSLETWSRTLGGSYTARLWSTARTKMMGYFPEWEIKASRAYDNNHTEYRPEVEADNLFWKLDGSPAHRGERGETLSFHPGRGTDAPATMTLEIALQATRKVRHDFHFKSIPAPPPGGELTVNQAADSEGARLFLQKVIHFTANHPLGRWDTAQRRQFNHPSGLALLFEDRSRRRGNPLMELECVGGMDDHGRRLVPRFGTDFFEGPDGRVRRWMVYLLPPAADTRHLNVNILLDQTTSGLRQKVIFGQLPVNP